MVALSPEEIELSNLEKKRQNLLGDFTNQQKIIDQLIREQKKRVAIKKDEVVRLVKDLKCERHPNAKFVRAEKIENSFWFAPRKKGERKVRNLWIYACKECLAEKKAGKLPPPEISKAYQCPLCGLVKGDFERRPYKSSEESWLALAGREGEHYHCRICDSMLGHYYWKFS